MPKNMMKIAHSAWYKKMGQGDWTLWLVKDGCGHQDSSGMQYRYSPYNNLGRPVIMKMMATEQNVFCVAIVLNNGGNRPC